MYYGHDGKDPNPIVDEVNHTFTTGKFYIVHVWYLLGRVVTLYMQRANLRWVCYHIARNRAKLYTNGQYSCTKITINPHVSHWTTLMTIRKIFSGMNLKQFTITYNTYLPTG